MNLKVFCCCLYLYNIRRSEEDSPLENDRSQHRSMNFMTGITNWAREKRKEKPSSTHDQLHQELGQDKGEERATHIYERPIQTPVESVSLVKKIVGKRLYRTFDRNSRIENQESVVPQGAALESPYDSFEATESFDREETSRMVTGSLTNRNPREVSFYQNISPNQPDYRNVEGWKVQRKSIPAPPPRCYQNQSAFFPKFDNRREIRSFQ